MPATEPVSHTPAVRRSGRWVTLFALAWFGVWLAQLTPFQLTLPEQINDWLGIDAAAVPESSWHTSVLAFGTVSGISAVFALIAFPLTGSLSDRTRSRFGRRRPWILGGTALFAAGLVGLGFSHTIVALTAFWCVALTGFSATAAALTALISDQVPVNQRGVVSSWVSAPQAIGVIVGIALAAVLGWGHEMTYLLLAGLLIATVAPFALLLEDPPHPNTRSRLTVAAVVTDLWISPRRHPDFGWTLLGRVLVNIGNALGTSLLFFFLQFGLRVDDPETDMIVVTAAYMVFVIAGALVCGAASDRLGRRKPFVLVAGLMQGTAAVCLTLLANLPMTMVAAALLGAGYGAFLGIDQALATQVLPDAEHTGQDLGIMNIAMAVPQALGPLIGAAVVLVTGGFTGLFVVSAVFGIAGGLSVLCVRSVR